MARKNRRRRLLLRPWLQIKLALYSTLPFVVALVWILNTHWLQARQWLESKGLDGDSVYEFRDLSVETVLSIALAVFFFLITNVVLSVYMAHRLIGPSIPFRRHIESLIAGDTNVTTTLRRKDAYQDVAGALNRLSEALAAREKGEPTPPPFDSAEFEDLDASRDF